MANGRGMNEIYIDGESCVGLVACLAMFMILNSNNKHLQNHVLSPHS